MKHAYTIVTVLPTVTWTAARTAPLTLWDFSCAPALALYVLLQLINYPTSDEEALRLHHMYPHPVVDCASGITCIIE